jgi:hypothetical protein
MLQQVQHVNLLLHQVLLVVVVVALTWQVT